MVAVTQSEEALRFARYLGYLSPVRKSASQTDSGPEFFPRESGMESCSTASDAGASDEQSSAAFDMADDLEKGIADEGFVAKNVRHPVEPATKFDRCSIVYQESSGEYHFMSEGLDLLMVARHLSQERRVEFFCQSDTSPRMMEAPRTPTSGSRPERRRPAFVMSINEDTDEWTLVQSLCECCAHRPRYLTCEYMGKGQQVARIRHSKRAVGETKVRVHSLDVYVPPLVNGTKSAVWCPMYTGKDLGYSTPSSAASRGSSASTSPTRRRPRPEAYLQLLPREEDEPLAIHTRLPEWDKEVESLVLNFKDRKNLCSSPRNFMLSLGSGQEADIVLQHAQNGKSTWCLDYKHPLSTVQAFAIAMASIEWD